MNILRNTWFPRPGDEPVYELTDKEAQLIAVYVAGSSIHDGSPVEDRKVFEGLLQVYGITLECWKAEWSQFLETHPSLENPTRQEKHPNR